MHTVVLGGPSAGPDAYHARVWRACLERQQGIRPILCIARDDAARPEAERVSADDHRWDPSTVWRVAALRDRFLDTARRTGARWALMADDDVILAPEVVDALLSAPYAPIRFGVFWTRWRNADQPLPQVWDYHPYHMEQATYDRIKAGEVTPVNGGGACTLFDLWAPIPPYRPLRGMYALSAGNGPMWGEDRHFCTRAEALGLEMLAVPGLRIYHAYGAPDRTPSAIQKACPWVPVHAETLTQPEGLR